MNWSTGAGDVKPSWRARLLAAGPVVVVGATLAGVAVAIALIVGLQGVNGTISEGHFSSAGAIGMCAQNMWHWKTVLPVVGYQEYASANYYMHHPLGVFWVVAILGKLFGFANWILRLPAIIYVTATPFFLYRISRDLWGPIEGGLSALAFVALPITLGFANYHDLEQPVMFGCVVATWGYLRFVRTFRERYAIASVVAFFFAINNDWEAYIWGGALLTGLFVRAYLLPPHLLAPLRARAIGRYWALMCGAAILGLALEVVLMNQSGRIADLMGMFFVRSSGDGLPLALVLPARKYRIELMFTPLAILLGKLALPVMFIRAAAKRSDLELLAVPLLAMAAIQYIVFKQGADVHIFWPHPFATYFGLAVGALAASARAVIAWVGARMGASIGGRLRINAPWIALGLIGLPVLFILKDGLSLVRLARETGGRFAEANLTSDIDRSVALRWFLESNHIPPSASIAFHPGRQALWAIQWEAREHPVQANQAVTAALTASTRVYYLDTRTASLADLRAAVSKFHVHAVGALWLMDRNQPAAPLDGYSFAEHDPSILERWPHGFTEPVRQVRADPWVTWEWRTLLGQEATTPNAIPVTDDQLRIAHNAAIERKDAAAAAALRAQLSRRFNQPLSAAYDNKTELLGATHARGAQRTVTLYFLSGKFTSDTRFAVRAEVVARPRLSTLPIDSAVLDLANKPTWPTTLWRPGHIYAVPVIYRKRPGTERLLGTWETSPLRTDRHDPVEVARIR